MGIAVRTIAGLMVWAAALLSVLQVGQLPGHGGLDHTLCGPWGCGPPVLALASWHGFWLVLMSPLVVLLVKNWSPQQLRRRGLLLLAAGIATMIGIALWQAAKWLPAVSHGQQRYFAQRVLFSVVTLTDLPVIPVTVAGIALCISGWTKR